MGPPRTCIIGAGISGIAAMRALQRADLPFVCFEAGSRVGGLWWYGNDNGMSNIYQSLHTNTSSRRSGFSEYPMPDDYPDFPSHAQVLAYLEDFVDHFNLAQSIRFAHRVEHVGRSGDGRYAVTVQRRDGSHTLETFDIVIVANGHHWDPYVPEFEGDFSGTIMHSSEYRRGLDFVDKRVLLVGVGNSSCDIAADLVRLAGTVHISTRSGAHVVPKYVLGKPIDQWVSPFVSNLPKLLQRMLFGSLLFLARGSQKSYAFPLPDAPLGTQHPTISSDILNLVGHGDVTIRPNISRMDGSRVYFADGTDDEFDVVIMATGFNITFPFLDDDLVRVADNRVDLFHYVAHPSADRLYFVGLLQPLGPLAPLAEAQAGWIADIILGRCKLPDHEEMWERIKEERSRIDQDYVHSRRHSIEVDFFQYLKAIRKEQSAP